MEIQSGKGRRILEGIPEATQFVRRNISFVPLSAVQGNTASLLRCIDGRRTNDPARIGPKSAQAEVGYISFPGGALGLCALVLSTIQVNFLRRWKEAEDARYETGRKAFEFEHIMAFFERALGGMSCHTDAHSEGEPMACAGCGHAMALLKGGYGLGDEYRESMRTYAIKLKQRAEAGEKGIVVDTYPGAHEEGAVLRIKCNLDTGFFISVPPNDGIESVFILNEWMNLRVLDDLTGQLYEEFRSEFKDHGISKEEMLAQTESLYFSQVRSSAFKLAHGLPVFDLLHTGPKTFEVRKSEIRY